MKIRENSWTKKRSLCPRAVYQKEHLKTQVPRQREIVDELARKICKDLNIPFVR